MKLVAYLHVSTDRQAEEGLGLDVQDRAIRRWACDNDHRIVVDGRVMRGGADRRALMCVSVCTTPSRP